MATAVLETGLVLPLIQIVAQTYGWEITASTEYREGFRFVVSGALTDQTESIVAEQYWMVALRFPTCFRDVMPMFMFPVIYVVTENTRGHHC